MAVEKAEGAKSILDQIKSILNIAEQIEKLLPNVSGLKVLMGVANSYPIRRKEAARSLIQIFGQIVSRYPADEEGSEIVLLKFPVKLDPLEAMSLLRYYGLEGGIFKDGERAWSETPQNILGDNPVVVALGSVRHTDWETEYGTLRCAGRVWSKGKGGFPSNYFFVGIR